MADEESEDKKDESGGKFSPKVIGIVVVVLGAAGYYFLGSSGGEPVDASVPTTTIALEEEADGAILNAGTLTVNLAGEGTRFGRLSFSLVLIEGVDPLTVEPNLPLILDAALTELAGFSASDLLGNAGQEKLRSVLSQRARDVLNVDDVRLVKRVVLTDLLVQ